jgi:hypothetical protein
MALSFCEEIMEPRRFEIEAERPAEPPTEQGKDPAPHATVQASADGESEDQRRDETIEEPGYGHGV